eukprot:763811-Hanusia_phi.AAC.7
MPSAACQVYPGPARLYFRPARPASRPHFLATRGCHLLAGGKARSVRVGFAAPHPGFSSSALSPRLVDSVRQRGRQVPACRPGRQHV